MVSILRARSCYFGGFSCVFDAFFRRLSGRAFGRLLDPPCVKMEVSEGGPDMRLDHAWQCLVKVGRFRKKSPPRRLQEPILAIFGTILASIWLPCWLHLPFLLPSNFACRFCSGISELSCSMVGARRWPAEHMLTQAELGM